MMQFFVSRELAKGLGPHVKPDQNLEPSLLWRADVAQIGVDTCVVAQEVYSKYVMVFCGLQGEGFRQFPELFRERFWREATALCLQGTNFEQDTLIGSLSSICDRQHYQLDPIPREEDRIMRVTEKLERLFLHEKQPLPLDGKAAFKFGIQVNGHPREREGRVSAPSPMELLRGACLDLVEQVLEQKQHVARVSSAVISEVDNVVTVDFGRKRKAS
ncbi:MAG: hypothetical protein VYA55_02520 [Pseudomonadota bacterium]|nr:hypothetical protein [Pseudomonadota bacterium]